MKIQGVQGAIDTEKLGFTLMHEHIMCANWAMRITFNKWVDRESVISQATKSLLIAKQYGLKTIVDATPINLGRDISVLQEVAERTGVQLIASTGLYYTEEPFLTGWEPEKIAQLLMTEITDGIQGTSVKPGIIKCATDESGISEANRKLLKATALLHIDSGLPVTTHSSSMSKNGREQMKVLLGEGVDPSKLIIGHCGDATDLKYIELILASGCYVGLDRFGLDNMCPIESRADTLISLCSKGYEKQIVLSHDYCSYIDWWPMDVFSESKARVTPRWSYHHLMEDVFPYLRERGVSDSQISTMVTDNPKRVFS